MRNPGGKRCFYGTLKNCQRKPDMTDEWSHEETDDPLYAD
jgi:hypothetical protein